MSLDHAWWLIQDGCSVGVGVRHDGERFHGILSVQGERLESCCLRGHLTPGAAARHAAKEAAALVEAAWVMAKEGTYGHLVMNGAST